MLPDNPAQYLTEWLFEIGPAASGSMDEAPLAIRQIAADLTALGIEGEPWELRLLRTLSIAWCNERAAARQHDRPAPYSGINAKPETVRAKVSRQIKALFHRR